MRLLILPQWYPSFFLRPSLQELPSPNNMSKQFDLVVKNGIVVTSGDTGKLDIAIKDGKIAHLAANISEDLAEKVIDAEGGYVMPGGVDAHVPVGGWENVPMTLRPARVRRSAEEPPPSSRLNRWEESLLQVVENYDARAKATGSYCDYAYHVIITRPELETLKIELPVIVEKWGITSCKLFMTYAALQLRDNELLDVMYEARKLAITTMIHAENGDLISWLTDKLEERGMVEPGYHAESRPPIVEMEATSRAIVLAEMIQNPVLFVHVGSASAAEVIRNAQTRGFPVFAETCPQYLHLTWEDLKKFHSPQCFENSKMICSPPPGPDDSDQEALWTGLRNGTFTIYSSDHCPFRYGDIDGKALGVVQHEESMQSVTCPVDQDHVHEVMHGKSGHFKYIPNGCPGIETRLPLLFNYGLSEGRITPERFVDLVSAAPAKLVIFAPRHFLNVRTDALMLVVWIISSKRCPLAWPF
ncbi:hypothetical protein CNBF3330 [Cryptococcus deneoformans B-3501A]|uniref:hypothetical protein n=1 Tax=Cryptococcus deneoformans (strain B-3501A) TaxID=283643 RepID=UPI000042FF4A|nr:hypothetical protein CNBF3330 [Cryptococcus neoformans var. neoformans B-3501A]EAL20006.1 hypothetical protein CNBF3330 [Cryptococcus neoformans var. neoformans B-3501A]